VGVRGNGSGVGGPIQLLSAPPTVSRCPQVALVTDDAPDDKLQREVDD